MELGCFIFFHIISCAYNKWRLNQVQISRVWLSICLVHACFWIKNQSFYASLSVRSLCVWVLFRIWFCFSSVFFLFLIRTICNFIFNAQCFVKISDEIITASESDSHRNRYTHTRKMMVMTYPLNSILRVFRAADFVDDFCLTFCTRQTYNNKNNKRSRYIQSSKLCLIWKQ